MTESMENTKMQSTHNFNCRNFVTEIFAKRFERFSFCWKNEYWQSYTQNYIHKKEAVVKKKGTTTESTENAEKQSTYEIYFRNFDTEIFAKCFEIFSICWKI